MELSNHKNRLWGKFREREGGREGGREGERERKRERHVHVACHTGLELRHAYWNGTEPSQGCIEDFFLGG